MPHRPFSELLADIPTTEEAEAIAEALKRGWLIPVQVFGADECCQHGAHIDCPSTGYGLCDRFSLYSPGGSDCNRADGFLLRPSDAVIAHPRVRAMLRAITDDST